MINLGIIANEGSVVNVLPSSSQLAQMKHEISVIYYVNTLENASFYTDDIEGFNPIYCNNKEELINESDIIVVDNPKSLKVQTKTSKIIITTSDVQQDYALIAPFINQNVDVFVFHKNFNLKTDFTNQFLTPQQLLTSFLRFYLGEPIPSPEIQLIGQSKIIERGRLTHKTLLHLID